MISRKQRNVAILAALALPAGLALAALPATFPFVAGTPIKAADVNAVISALEGRLATLEAAAAARPSYYVEQGSTDANANVDDVWVDLPSVAIPLTFAAPTKIRYQLFARVYNFGAAAGTTTACSVRLVSDDAGTALIPSAFPATLGDWNGFLSGDLGPNNAHQVALGGLVTMPAGTYNFKAQIIRPALTGNSGNCQISRWSFSRARFFIDVVP